jgi:hypothetical protein
MNKQRTHGIDLPCDLGEWMLNCNFRPATIAAMSAMSTNYARAVMRILRTGSRPFSNAELTHIAIVRSLILPQPWSTAWGISDKCEPRNACPNCGGDVRVGRHEVLVNPMSNEPPDYRCEGEFDGDEELPY